MGIKGELQKAVNAGQEKLNKGEGVHEIGKAQEIAKLVKAKELFVSLANQLEELSESLDPQYGEILVKDTEAKVTLFKYKEPKYSASPITDQIFISCDTITGYFIVEELAEDRSTQESRFFKDAEATMEWLLGVVGERIAYLDLQEIKANELRSKYGEKN